MVLITNWALKARLVAKSYHTLAIAMMWLVGLFFIGLPGAAFWALLGAILLFIPEVGLVLASIGPSLEAVIAGRLHSLLYVLILYAVIVVVDGLVLQPHLLKRGEKGPIWASILTPLLLGSFLSFWGVALSAPLLSVISAYRTQRRLYQQLQAAEE